MPLTEAEKIRPRIIEMLRDRRVLDLGCGRMPVVPWAHGVDDSSESKILEPGVVIAKVDPESRELGYGPDWDVVFSSHAVEHMSSPIGRTLSYWLGFVRPGGHLVFYLPDERRYRFDPENPRRRNPGHHHYLTPETFRWHLEQLPVDEITVEEDPHVFDRYSFLAIARKR